MDNIYADALNQALGTQQPVTTGRVHHPECKSTAKRLAVQREAQERPGPALIAHSEVYKGVLFVVREYPGVSSIAEPPAGKCAYWSVYYTDAELADEASGEVSTERRADICRNAIDRMLADAPIWTGKWYERPLP